VLDASGATLADLQLGCVYGAGTPSGTPVTTQLFSGGTFVFAAVQRDGTLYELRGTSAPGPLGCSQGPLASSRCLGGPSHGEACTDDEQCGAVAGDATCTRAPRCWATPPLEVASTTFPGVVIPVCLVNVVAADVTGTLDVATGALESAYPVDTHVHLESCPVCRAASATCSAGDRAGLACTPQGPDGTSIDCPPAGRDYFGSVRTELRATTATASASADAAGTFCEGQDLPGAFGLPAARTIVQRGAPAGDLRNGELHEFTHASVTCVPRSRNPTIDLYGGLPYPLAVSTRGTLQLEPLP